MSISWETLGNISTIVGLGGSCFALLAWLQAKIISRNVKREKDRLNQEIKIILKGEDERHIIKLPFTLRRREIVRSELLGLIGMLPMKNPKERFEIRFLSTPEFRQLLSEAQDGNGEAEMIIPCANSEIEQFDCTGYCYENHKLDKFVS